MSILRVIFLLFTRVNPTDEELKILNEKMVEGAQGEMFLADSNTIVKMNGQNFWNEDKSYGDRLYSCSNCPESSVWVYSCKQMKDYSQEAHADLRNFCKKCG